MIMKLLIIAVAISLCLPSFAMRTRGGDMPFPIGKVIDFPKDDGKGVWKDELKQKIFRLRPLKGVLDEGTILVQMLGLNKVVLAEGLGQVGKDQILTATLRYINSELAVDIKIANLCADALFDNQSDFSSVCKKKEMWAAVKYYDKYFIPSQPERFVIRKSRER
jgi:hypothetical protein